MCIYCTYLACELTIETRPGYSSMHRLPNNYLRPVMLAVLGLAKMVMRRDGLSQEPVAVQTRVQKPAVGANLCQVIQVLDECDCGIAA